MQLPPLAHPLVVNDRLLIQPCLELVLYLEHAWPDAILDFWHQSTEALADRLSHYCTDTMRDPAKLSTRADRMVETWMKRPRIGDLYCMHLTCSPQASSDASVLMLISILPDPIPPEWQEQERVRLRTIYTEVGHPDTPPITVLRMTIPLDHKLAEPSAFIEWLLELGPICRGQCIGGHAGLAVNFDDGVSLDSQRIPMTSRLAALLSRHPGLDWDYPGAVIRELLRYRPDTADFVPQIKRVNWLTLVSSATIDELGDPDEIISSLRADNGADYPRVFEFPGAVLIQAQPSPALGDVTQGDHLPAYRRVAAVLEPMRLQEHPELGGALNEERVQQWLEAFDRPLPTDP